MGGSDARVPSMAIAPGRGLRKDQRSDPRLVSGRGSRGRGAGKHRHQDAGPQSGTEILEEIDVGAWTALDDRDGSQEVLRRCAEGAWPRRCSRNGALAKQPGRNPAPAIPTTRAGDVAVPTHAKIAEVRLSACLGPQPLSDGAPPPEPQHLQADPRRRSHRVVRPSCGLTSGRGWGNRDRLAFD